MKKDFTIEAGLKGSFIDIKSDANYLLFNATTDTTLENNYTYKERVLAAYTTLSKTYKNCTTGKNIKEANIIISFKETKK